MNRQMGVLMCIIVAVMMVVTCAFAEEWRCPECSTQNDGNFCSNCGEKKPEVTAKPSGTSISNIGFELQDSGDVIVSWDDSSNLSPYTVSYQAQYDSGYWDEIKGKKFTLEYLIPGETYSVSISNGRSEASASYTVPVSVFTEFKSGKKIVLSESSFSISEVDQNRTKQYEFQVHYPSLRNDRSYKAKLVTRTPHGYGGYTWVWSTYELESRYAYIYTNFSMYEFFEGIKNDFGEIPTGRYTLEFYFDGELYGEFSFNVRQ